MAAFLGPETPRPFAVISERYQRELELVKGDFPELYSFGEVYEKSLCSLIYRAGEVNIDDRVAYVGPEKGSIAEAMERRYALVHPVTTITPGTVFFEPTPGDHNMAVKKVGIGAEIYFQQLAKECEKTQPLFDTVVLRDAIEFIEDRQPFYANVMATLDPKIGRFVILHRPSAMVTLPYYQEARDQTRSSDVPYMDIISDLQELGFDVQWEVEILPVIIPRTQWLSQLYHRFPNHLEVTSSSDVYSGLRELTEGQLKYSHGLIEFVDRLLVISVSHNPTGVPNCQRLGGSDLSRAVAPVRFELEVTSELLPMVGEPPPEVKPRQSREEWWGTVKKERWANVDSARIPTRRLNQFLD